MTTMPLASPLRTRLPTSTWRRPSRPEMGATIFVNDSWSFALFTCASFD
jgi:hypothetical protein